MFFFNENISKLFPLVSTYMGKITELIDQNVAKKEEGFFILIGWFLVHIWLVKWLDSLILSLVHKF